MKTADVKKLEPLDQFLYWIRERQNIYLRRRAGLPKPWTDDEVLQSYFFTNPYRENDKVTVWFRENIRQLLSDDPDVLFATVCFRWFNLIESGERLMVPHTLKVGMYATPIEKLKASLLCNWNPKRALSLFNAVKEHGGQVFTGAFMINSPPGEAKLDAIVRRINNVWVKRDWLLDYFKVVGKTLRLQEVHEKLTEFDGMGGFMAYEVVTDLRHTYLLRDAPDKLTWCNPGPGCIRGLYRILGMPFEKGNNSSSPAKPPDWLDKMRWLLAIAHKRLHGIPALEMREIEHSLCETDKYLRAVYGDGKLKRKFNGK